MVLSKPRIRAYARTIDAGLRTMEEVQEEYRVEVYVELITTYNWTIEQVDTRYKEQVEQLLVNRLSH